MEHRVRENKKIQVTHTHTHKHTEKKRIGQLAELNTNTHRDGARTLS